MTRLDRISALLHALGRLTPHMARHMVRRALRNRLAPRCPARYRTRLRRIEKTVPPPRRPKAALPPGLIAVADHYRALYGKAVDDAAHGHFRFYGRTAAFGDPASIDWTHRPPGAGDSGMWAIKLAHMGVLCPMLADGTPAQHRAARTMIEGAARCCAPTDPGAFHGFWFPYAVSHRVLALTSGLMIARAGGGPDPDTDRAASGFLRAAVAFLLDNVEHELGNNHVERNLAALCLYFSHTDTVPPALVRRLERDVAHLLRTTVLDDGCQAERAPMYQELSVVALGAFAEAPFLSQTLRRLAARKASAAARAFAMLCHADGEPALFNDGWHGEVPRWTGPPPPGGLCLLPRGGYARLSSGTDLCLMDAGPPGPRANPGHGHADFLSLEIDLAGHRVIVDPGTSDYRDGSVRNHERSAAAHNGPCYRRVEPLRFPGPFKVGRLVRAELSETTDLPDLAIAGRLIMRAGRLGRLVECLPGQGFLIADLWSAPAPGGQVGWLVPGNWALRAEAGALHLSRPGAQAILSPLLPGAAPPAVTPAQYACRYGRREAAHRITLNAQRTPTGQQALLCWIGHGPPPAGALGRGRAQLATLSGLISSRRGATRA